MDRSGARPAGDPAGRVSSDDGTTIAVVIASFRDPDLLRECLDSLDVARSRVPATVPVVVARAGDASDVADMVRDRPGVTLVPVPGGGDVPHLRGAGLSAAPAADWVAVTEDHCLAHPEWLVRLRDAAGPGVDVVGGGMGNARPGAVDWAAYFSEYGFFSSTRPREPGDGHTGVPLLTGANAAYAERVVPEVARRALAGEWENTIHRRLHEQGAVMRWEPRARILQNGTYAVGAFCRDRFEHGRDFARTRLVEEEDAPRWILAAGAPVLPVVLTARVGRAAAGENRAAFLWSLPITATFLAAWSWGEAVGYLMGEP